MSMNQARCSQRQPLLYGVCGHGFRIDPIVLSLGRSMNFMIEFMRHMAFLFEHRMQLELSRFTHNGTRGRNRVVSAVYF